MKLPLHRLESRKLATPAYVGKPPPEILKSILIKRKIEARASELSHNERTLAPKLRAEIDERKSRFEILPTVKSNLRCPESRIRLLSTPAG